MPSFRLLAPLAALLFSASSASALDLFARFEGGVETNGEALGPDRVDWVDLSAFEMGVENTINLGSASGGAGAGKASFKEVTLTKKVDKASPPLMLSSATGQAYDTVTIEFTRTGGAGTPPVIYRMIMKLVYVQSVSSSYNEGDDSITETVVLRHGAHQITTFKQENNGSISQSGQYEWSVVLNSATLDVTP